MSQRRLGAVAAVLLMIGAVLALASPAGAGKGNSSEIGSGPDYLYAGSDALSSASATVSAASLGGGNSQITLAVSGVDAPAGTTFGAHVHVNPCGSVGGAAGGHYLHADAGTDGPLKNREVWLDFSIDANGKGHANATRQFEVTDRANRSVIIHIMGTDHASGGAGDRLACIDLDG